MATLHDLLVAVWHVVGDRVDNPRFYPRLELVTLLNEGALQFRVEVEDEWYTREIPVAAGVQTYTFPEDHLRAQRLAYADETMEARGSVGALTGEDENWQTSRSPSLIYWSSDAVNWNQFRVIGIPTQSSPDYWVWSQDLGTIVRFQNPTDFTFTGGVGGNPDRGIVWYMEDSTFFEDRGVIVGLEEIGAAVITVWGTLKPQLMSGDGDEVPIKPAYWMAPAYYALGRLYEHGRDRHNAVLAGLYKGMWQEMIDQAKALSEEPMPRMVNVIGAAGQGYRQVARFANTIGGGVGDVRWPLGT